MSRGAGPGRRQMALRLTMVAAVLVLGGRLFQVQVLDHERYFEEAQDQWLRTEPLPAQRGDLLDRSDRPLAVSTVSWRVGVATSQLEEPAAVAAGLGRLLGLDVRATARRLERGRGHHVVLARDAVISPADLDSLAATPAVTIEPRQRRFYPLDGVGASLIGFQRPDGEAGEIATGLEAGLTSTLSGTPGLALRLATALQGRSLGKVVRRPPRHGCDVALTIDADLQAVCEEALARSVRECDARDGAVLVLDPACGDVLAAAATPLLPDRARPYEDPTGWNNLNFTTCFEPGSVFKIFTSVSLLSHGAIDTGTVFDCSDDDFGRFHVRNSESHEYGPLSWTQAFVKSSNIYFARAVANLGAAEFYRDLTDLGFGQRPRLAYPGQPAGLLAPPERWSGRSKATIAIGQEVAVTPLQLALAASAVANGGWLYAPRIVREVRDHDGNPLRTCAPAPLRRVMSEPLAAMLRLVMRRVVTEGTGVNADLDWIEVGGKTGTAQKSQPGRGYVPGRYTASFLGLVPWDEPRLVILTMLDEPDYAHHYAAQSAAPLFAEVVRGVRQATDWLTGLGTPLLAEGGAAGEVAVPDVLFLSAAAAQEELRRAGLACAGDEREGMVVEQVPGPGARCPGGTVVTLTVAAGRQPRQRPLCPDLAGLSERQVLGLAARLGLPVRVRGTGYVGAQQPAAGQPVGAEGIQVRMVAAWR